MRSTARYLLLIAVWAVVNHGPALAQCPAANPNTYTFTSFCPYPIWIGQHNSNATQSYPPVSGNWALAATCTSNSQCASQQTCSNGQCTCSSSSDCSGGAPCQSGLCSTSATFCMPQTWISGVFWPRTGCTLSGTTLTCTTGQCGATGALDCGYGNNGLTGQPPMTLLEVTSGLTGTSAPYTNYDVSLNSGYNVETQAVPVVSGGSCPSAGCTSDLNQTCPANLQLTVSGTLVGCYDPCDECTSANPSSGMLCGSTISGAGQYTDCSGNNGSVTYQDMYCAKNSSDGNAQASSNQGTPTCFAANDCPAGSTCQFSGFSSTFTPPQGGGVCINTAITNYSNAQGTCTSSNVGAACGGYLLNYSGYNALGYTCQPVTMSVSGQQQTFYTCLPGTGSGLGTCYPPNPNTAGTTQLYTAVGGVFNQAWLTAGTQAGGGTTPYYQTFKNACPAAYTFQYDDSASGLSCTNTSSLTWSGFNVTFCGSLAPAQAKKKSVPTKSGS